MCYLFRNNTGSYLETVIANGNEPQNLIRAIKGEKIGTRVISE